MKLLDRVDKMLSDDIAKLMVLESLSPPNTIRSLRGTCFKAIIERNTFQLKHIRLLRGTCFKAMVPLEEQMGREQGTDKIEGGAFSGVNKFNIIE